MKELLIKLKEDIEKEGLHGSGLCNAIVNMRGLEMGERSKLIDYIYDNVPKTLRTILGFDFWWKPGHLKPRVRWLNKQIKKRTL